MIWEKPIQNTRNFLNQPTYLPINLWPGFGNNQPTYLIKKNPIKFLVTYPLEKLGSCLLALKQFYCTWYLKVQNNKAEIHKACAEAK